MDFFRSIGFNNALMTKKQQIIFSTVDPLIQPASPSQLDIVPGNLVEQALASQPKHPGCLGTIAPGFLERFKDHPLFNPLDHLL